MPAKKNYHKLPEDPGAIGGTLEQEGREGIVAFAKSALFGQFQ